MKQYDDVKKFMLTDSIGFLINRASNDLGNEVDRALKDIGITGQQMGILLAVEGDLAATPLELAKLLGIDPGLMSRMLDKLEEQGFLERSRSDEDRRVVIVTLTSHGHEVAARLPAIACGAVNARLDEFSEEEFRQMHRLLRKFVGN
jgi:DNA-binding MarR family transcriptional regulator